MLGLCFRESIPWPTTLPQNPAAAVNERRSPRRRTFLAGKVVYGAVMAQLHHSQSFGNGAKITLARGECVPTRVFLIDRRTATAYEARVRWIKAPDFGLAFVNEYSLGTDLPAAPALSHAHLGDLPRRRRASILNAHP
jgi:hypothetical protein